MPAKVVLCRAALPRSLTHMNAGLGNLADGAKVWMSREVGGFHVPDDIPQERQ